MKTTTLLQLGSLGVLTACGADRATATPSSSASTSTAACAGASATVLAPGQVIAALPGTSICISAGRADGEYTLISFNGSTVAASNASLVFRPNGTDPVSTAALASLAPSRAVFGSGGRITRTVADRFEARLRANEVRALTPLIPGARRAYAARRGGPGAALDVIPSAVSVGQLLTLNANGDSACNTPQMRTARVVAITNRAIVVADTANPAGGYTDADYQSIGVTFDTLVDPLDTRNFGQPSDIDGNGHVILFFTRAVNALTPAKSSSYIGGFFFSRDLFPVIATSDFDACPTSNYGELFYLMVPDPSGVVNGNAFSKSRVTSIAIATVAHEYQHLINASRRLYVNTTATDFEEVWLNEGLSHIAEELLFYAQSHLQPRQDLDATTIRSSVAWVAAFNDDQADNISRLQTFLESTTNNSPYAANDSLETRGATWSFLRYAADHQSAPDTAVWYQLVNSTTTGISNLQQAFGSGLSSLFRDWGTSLLADDVVGATASYQQPSWNLPSLYTAIRGTYPLQTIALTSGTPASVTVDGGGVAFLRFGVGAGKTASVTWGALPQNVELTVVRTK